MTKDLYGEELSRHISREKVLARELRHSRWWQQRCIAATCYYCNEPLLPTAVTMEHVVPLSQGGKSTKANLVPACKTCNNLKKNLNPVDWFLHLEQQRKRMP